MKDSLFHSNYSNENIHISSWVLWAPDPAEQCKESQMAPAWVVSCITGEESCIREPKSFIVGSKQACFAPKRNTISISQVCTLRKHLWKVVWSKKQILKAEYYLCLQDMHTHERLMENHLSVAVQYGFNAHFTDNEDRHLFIVFGNSYILFLKIAYPIHFLQDLWLAWIFPTNLGESLVVLCL